ncbi:VOC family protein [Enemella evansiae]|uniref:VOC family protein n=1 Tax=Enemella evansiae TaxID=2016499 RepID=UPI001551F88B|nr:VOC family protein [Enemella evansiae]
MTITQVQVNLFCTDVEKCLAFYVELGLPEAFRYPKTGPIEHVEVDAAGVRIGLTAATVANELAGLGVVPGIDPSAEVALWSDDLDGAFGCAVRAGAAVVTEPMDSPDGRLRYAWVRDPDGHQLKLIQYRSWSGAPHARRS